MPAVGVFDNLSDAHGESLVGRAVSVCRHCLQIGDEKYRMTCGLLRGKSRELENRHVELFQRYFMLSPIAIVLFTRKQ